MLTVTILVVLGIGLLALASNKHFKLVGWLYENKKRHTRKAVSYTHLTLPTIYSV